MADPLPNPAASSLITAPPTTVNVDGGPPMSPTPQTSGNPLAGQTIPPQPMAQAPTQQQPTAAQHQVAQTVKHGLAWNALTGSHTEWQQTPQGPVPQKVPNKAQDLFRSILAGAIMGAGAPTVPGQNYANAGRGVAAATQGMQQQQDRAQGQAQQQWNNQQQASSENQKNQLIQAQIANMQAETAARHATLDLQSQEYHDRHNAASAALLDSFEKAGGSAPIDGKLPSELPASQLTADYVKDPSIRQAPSGYTRHFVDKTDASELTYNGVHWEHPDGTPADLSDKTTVHVVDVPINAMTTKIPTSGKDINAAYGQKIVDSDKTYPVAPIDMVNARATNLKDSREQATIDLDRKKVGVEASRVSLEAAQLQKQITSENRAEFAGADKDISERISVLQKRSADPLLDPAVKKHIETQIDKATGELKKIRTKLYPNTNVDDLETDDADKVAHPDTQASLMKIPGFNPEVAAQVANMDPAAISQNIASAPMTQAQKDQIYSALNITPPKPDQVTLKKIVQGAAKNFKENVEKEKAFFGIN